jgi:L,D-peptidoglycan transpeptidase YkuD (ErfK/YbiS/YcfS/YnhG family)
MGRIVMNRVRTALVVLLALGTTAASCSPRQRPRARHVVARTPAPVYSTYVPWGEHSVESRLAEIGPKARKRWRDEFAATRIAYPPASVEMVVFKRERRVEVYAGSSAHNLSFVRSIAITAASGGPGPKLREGDRQVPEGVYEVDSLNPNSSYHVSLRLDYPNDFDRRMGQRDHRANLGSAIMIHGSDRSIGCVAVGDDASEDLFVLAADAGLENVAVVIVPRDFRRTGEHELMPGQPTWVHDLYADLDVRLRSLPAARAAAPSSGGLTAR